MIRSKHYTISDWPFGQWTRPKLPNFRLSVKWHIICAECHDISSFRPQPLFDHFGHPILPNLRLIANLSIYCLNHWCRAGLRPGRTGHPPWASFRGGIKMENFLSINNLVRHDKKQKTLFFCLFVVLNWMLISVMTSTAMNLQFEALKIVEVQQKDKWF
jgi:hypothetical protein